MNSTEYNIRTIALCTVAALSSILLAFILIKDGLNSGWFKKHFNIFKITTLSIGICVSIIIFVYMFFSISYKEAVLKNLKVEDIINQGSFGGLMDTQTLFLKNDNGDIIIVQTTLGSSKALYNRIEDLKIGDNINIKYVEGSNNLYYVEHSD